MHLWFVSAKRDASVCLSSAITRVGHVVSAYAPPPRLRPENRYCAQNRTRSKYSPNMDMGRWVLKKAGSCGYNWASPRQWLGGISAAFFLAAASPGCLLSTGSPPREGWLYARATCDIVLRPPPPPKRRATPYRFPTKNGGGAARDSLIRRR